MPGSPPRSNTDPRTSPPPVTRSNSATPEASRGASSVWLLSGSITNRRPLRDERAAPAAPSATSVFQAPQASQRPAQRAEAAPQLWQTKFGARATIDPSSTATIDEMATRPEPDKDFVADRAGGCGDLVDGDGLTDERCAI